jgi:hypothetical protein
MMSQAYQEYLFVLQFHWSPWLSSRNGGRGPGTARFGLHAGTAVLDPHSASLCLDFAAQEPSVFGMLSDFGFNHFLKRSFIVVPHGYQF